MHMTARPFQSPGTVAACLVIGAIGLLVMGIQPLLLGALVNARVISIAELGRTATVEVVMMALGLFCATALLRGERAKLLVCASGGVMAAANVATCFVVSAFGVAVLRGVAGLTEGVLVAVSVLAITFGQAPGRLNAIFLTVGAAPQLVLAFLLPAYIAPRLGMLSGFLILGGAGLLAGVVTLGVRQRFAPAITESSARIVWSPVILLALAASLITSAAIGACWAYVEPLGSALGLSPADVGLAVTVSLLFQVASTLLIAVIGWRLPFAFVLIGGAIGQIVTVWLLTGLDGPVQFDAALAVFGFLWQGCMPFGTDLIVSVDESRATAPLLLPLTLLGLSIGPFIASFFVGSDVRTAFGVGLAGFVVSFFLYAATFLLARRNLPRSAPDVGAVPHV